MPLYEYRCDACGHQFEIIQKFSDPPVETCPKCGGAVTKLISSPAIQFKGTGWYVTDYAKRSGTPAGDGGGGQAPESGKGSPAADSSTSGSSASSSAAPASKDS
ncbi:MAG: zinc ribbon domain-containing protein [Acidobacteriota bacterium]|nr:zinc ribbon domain-containing protein [Acidobacteriota bacterium]